jgi:hypothetical protein
MPHALRVEVPDVSRSWPAREAHCSGGLSARRAVLSVEPWHGEAAVISASPGDLVFEEPTHPRSVFSGESRDRRIQRETRTEFYEAKLKGRRKSG